MQTNDTLIEVVIIDATEQPIEQPKKQKRHFSGKKKCHTQKAQLIINFTTLEIVTTAFSEGKKHDF